MINKRTINIIYAPLDYESVSGTRVMQLSESDHNYEHDELAYALAPVKIMFLLAKEHIMPWESFIGAYHGQLDVTASVIPDAIEDFVNLKDVILVCGCDGDADIEKARTCVRFVFVDWLKKWGASHDVEVAETHIGGSN